MALLRAMTALKAGGEGRLCVAHFDHCLRSEESTADEAFVVDLCRQFALPCEVGRGQVAELAADLGDGLEAAARRARYEFLEQTAARLGARYIVTAHTADDQAETILHRILRGTGIGGLAGMARVRPLSAAATLIRPLLGVRRARLLAYLDGLGQAYRSDSSNDDVRFTRNRIRHELLPRLAEWLNPGVVDALLRLGGLAGEVQAVVESVVEDLAEQCVVASGCGVIEIDASGLHGRPAYVIRALLMSVWRKQSWPMQAMGFAQWDLLAAMLSAASERPSRSPAKQTFPGSVLAEAVADRLRLLRVER